MIKELEIFTPNLRGAAVTVENQIHSLFKLSTRKPPSRVCAEANKTDDVLDTDASAQKARGALR